MLVVCYPGSMTGKHTAYAGALDGTRLGLPTHLLGSLLGGSGVFLGGHVVYWWWLRWCFGELWVAEETQRGVESAKLSYATRWADSRVRSLVEEGALRLQGPRSLNQRPEQPRSIAIVVVASCGEVMSMLRCVFWPVREVQHFFCGWQQQQQQPAHTGERGGRVDA